MKGFVDELSEVECVQSVKHLVSRGWKLRYY